MAELIGLIASCVNIVQGINAVSKALRENIHLSGSASKELGLLVGKLSLYRGLIEGIQFQAEFDKVSHGRLSALGCANGPIEACRTAIALLQNRVQKLPKHVIFGKLIDKETASSLKAFDEALPILQLALDADQRVIATEVEKYVKIIKEDLSAMRVDNDFMREDVSELKQIIVDQQTRQVTYDQEVENQKLREWITMCDPTRTYQACLEKASSRSGSWFLEHEFNEWLEQISDDIPRIMWLRGMSGAGKTILISLAIKHHQKLQVKNHIPILAYFYCSFFAKESQSTANMLGSYIAQLCDQIPGLVDVVKSLRMESKSRQGSELKRPSIVDLEKIIQLACGMTRNVVLYLDAPNESDTCDEILNTLSKLISSNTNLRLLISSTKDLDPYRWLQPYPLVRIVEMSSGKVDQDICSYIDRRIHQERRLRRLPTQLQDVIRETLSNNARGSFRWAECQMVALVENARSEADIERSLSTTSPSLEGLYTASLLNTRPSDRQYLKSALLWLTFSVRPLHLRELSEAMVFKDSSTSIDPTQRLFLDEAEEILSSCRMLVSYNADSGYATLAHSSVQQYLVSEQCRFSPAGFFHFDVAKGLSALSCLSVDYLNMTCFVSGYCATLEDVEERFREWPLLEYVSFAWPVYMREISWPLSGIMQRTETALLKFFQSAHLPRGGNFGSWVQVYIPRHLKANQSLSQPLYYAARSGLVEVGRMILRVEGKGVLEVRGGSRESTPLHVACAFGYTEMVQMLLEEGADPNERNGYEERGIEWAVMHGYHDIVELLLKYEASPVTQEGVDKIIIWIIEESRKSDSS